MKNNKQPPYIFTSFLSYPFKPFSTPYIFLQTSSVITHLSTSACSKLVFPQFLTAQTIHRS